MTNLPETERTGSGRGTLDREVIMAERTFLADAKAAAKPLADGGSSHIENLALTGATGLAGTGNALPVLSMPGSPLIVEATSLGTTVVTYTVTASDTEDGPLTPTVTRPDSMSKKGPGLGKSAAMAP